jgi:poly-gamma-glutamate synthesis protein (capsule biosynthesis protein)
LRRGAALLLLIVLLASGLGTGLARSARQRLEPYPWVFLRGGQPLRAGETLAELAAVGDTSLARGVDYRQAFGDGAGWLRQADLAMLNLESAIAAPGSTATGGGSPPDPYRLVAPSKSAAALARAGIDLAGLANNHAADDGSPGQTAAQLVRAGITPVGIPGDYRPVLRQVKGVRLAFLAFNAVAAPGTALWEREAGLAAVRRAKLEADALIVSMHWGYEYDRRAAPGQVDAAQALLAAGADLVVGHHPHVAQEVLVWQREDGSGRAAALSLGNFAFDQAQGETRLGLALRAFFDRQGLRALQLVPVVAGPRPRLAPPGTRLPAVQQAAPDWETVRFACGAETCLEREGKAGDPAGATPGAAIFRSGSLDLTGDRLPEEVLLAGGRVRIFSGGALTWESPREWRVLDLAAGDPDADGRADLVLALEKPDARGTLQSHPFVIGYRGGRYRTVWGGSAVADPLREVALGDVDGDGALELVVLEADRSGRGRALTAWRWHGWGFSLLWRSPYAAWEGVEVEEGGLRARRPDWP